MKKILLLLLCVVLAVTMLASCDEGGIGEYEYPDFVPNYVPAITLDLYIVVGENTSDLAIDSVGRMLSQYTETKFKTSLNVHYILEAEYEKELRAGIAKTGDAKADIVLVNSAELMESLVSDKLLHDMTSYYDGAVYGRLNTIVTNTLIEASKIDGKLYSVPNDHVVGSYTYLLINEAEATNRHNFSPESLKTCKSLDDEVIVELKAAIESEGKNFDDFVKVVTGDSNDKAAYEAEGYICNVSKYPEVDADEAFSSAFSIVNGIQYPDRAMEVIYLLNTDVYFRNLLQYGVEGVNYIKEDDGKIVSHTDGDGVYDMNMLYTGSSFMLYYSDAWTEEMKNVGLAQNDDSIIYVPAPEIPAPETPNPETPDPETPNPETPNPETPNPETPNPDEPQGE